MRKDFWNVLFNGLAEHHPRLLFQRGTSLSKSFGLIDRFSEDIDITLSERIVGLRLPLKTGTLCQ